MKIFIDVVYTQRPRICSTSYLAWELIEALTAWREDLFIYLGVNREQIEQEDIDFFNSRPGRERVQLVHVAGNRVDRTSELYMMSHDIHSILHPLNRETWDIDVVISSRIPVLKHYMVHCARPGAAKMCSPRMFVGLEEMPVLPFRDTVPWHEYLFPDTLMSYGLADAILINNQWTRKELRTVAKEVLSMAWQKRVLENVHEVVPVALGRLGMRGPGAAYNGGDFNVAFVGRMTATRNFGAVAELFRKQFSYPLGPNKAQMKFNISTNSQSHGAADPGEIDFIDLQMNDRPKFHAFLKAQHVAVNLTTVEDFSLSTYETLLAGVPIIMYDHPWNSFLGTTYPFRCKNETEAYALLTRFAADYEEMYERFRDWESQYWATYVADPTKNVTTSQKLISLIQDWEARRAEIYSVHGKSLVPRVEAVMGETIDLNPLVFEGLASDTRSTELALGRVPSTLVWKLVSQQLGYKDTEQVGVLTK